MAQDCNKPWYRENYIAFFEALRYSYPHLRLIANCNMGDGAPTDLYDWHIYTGANRSSADPSQLTLTQDCRPRSQSTSSLGVPKIPQHSRQSSDV